MFRAFVDLILRLGEGLQMGHYDRIQEQLEKRHNWETLHPVKTTVSRFWRETFSILLRFIRKRLNALRCFIQRGRKGYSKSDLTAADQYLAAIIESMLLSIADSPPSFPPTETPSDFTKKLLMLANAFNRYHSLNATYYSRRKALDSLSNRLTFEQLTEEREKLVEWEQKERVELYAKMQELFSPSVFPYLWK